MATERKGIRPSMRRYTAVEQAQRGCQWHLRRARGASFGMTPAQFPLSEARDSLASGSLAAFPWMPCARTEKVVYLGSLTINPTCLNGEAG